MEQEMHLKEHHQYSAFFHPLRQKIIHVLDKGPATPSEVARQIGIAASKAHYHVRILEKAGIVKLAETRRVGSITETYFELAARHFRVESPTEHVERILPVIADQLVQLTEDLRQIASQGMEAVRRNRMLFSMHTVHAAQEDEPTVQEAAQMLQGRFAAACEEFPGRRYRLVVALVPESDGAKSEED